MPSDERYNLILEYKNGDAENLPFMLFNSCEAAAISASKGKDILNVFVEHNGLRLAKYYDGKKHFIT